MKITGATLLKEALTLAVVLFIGAVLLFAAGRGQADVELLKRVSR